MLAPLVLVCFFDRSARPASTQAKSDAHESAAFRSIRNLVEGSGQIDGTMVIAVPVMDMMQMAFDQIVRMIAVGNGFVAATVSMGMTGVVLGAAVAAAAARLGLGETMLIHVIAMHVMEMPVMKIIDMIIVLHGQVAAALAVLMGMFAVYLAAHLSSHPSDKFQQW